jgi:two-component system cell cycle response regulator DivK
MARILIVEDNELNRDMLARRLSRFGHQILVAVDGLECLAVTRSEHPDLVVMDMSLPRLDGFETTRQLKADPATRAIPVFALTAHAMEGDREKCLAAGCDDYATKPMNFPQVLQQINALLGE